MDGIGQRLDSARSSWLLFTLELDCSGESWIPGFRQREDGIMTELRTFVTFDDFARTPPANSQENTLCGTPRPSGQPEYHPRDQNNQ